MPPATPATAPNTFSPAGTPSNRTETPKDIFSFGGIHMTGLSWRRGCGPAPGRRALSGVCWGVSVLVCDRRRLSGLSGLVAVARRLRLPAVRACRRVGCRRWALKVRALRWADIGDGGDSVRSPADSSDGVVHGVLDVRDRQGRHVGAELASDTGDWFLPNGVGDVVPAALGAGASWS
jgi:hypothetical protein